MFSRLKLFLAVALKAAVGFTGVLAAAAPPAPDRAAAKDELVCPNCAKLDHKSLTTVVGSCQNCGKFTGHQSIHYCDKCAKDKKVCRYCGKSLAAKAGTGVVVPAPKTHRIEYKQPFIKSLNIHRGDTVLVFAKHKGDPGLFDPPASFPYARTVDNKPDDVLSSEKGVKRLDKDTIQVGRFQALRAGEAAILFWDFGGAEYARIKVTVTVGQEQAAEEGLKELKQLYQLDPKQHGFASLSDLNSAVLGTAIFDYRVSLSDLRSWNGNKDAGKMMYSQEKVRYPVLAGGKICRELWLSKRNGSWGYSAFSSPSWFNAIEKARTERVKVTGLKSEDFRLVAVLGDYFLAYKLKSQWYFVNLFPSRDFKIGQILTAEKVFDTLKPAAIRHNGLPG